ncbi:MAG: vitamin B12 transporter [Halopseudomonas sp.]|jgi:vitamin B12 transporter
MMNKYLLLAPALLAASIAQANSLDLPDTVVTASRMEQPRSEAHAASSVFTRADIERLQPSDVPALLQRVPGLHIARNGGPGSLTGVFLRGTTSAQTLVLVDGQRISGSSSGITSLELLNIEHIERIEVVRGGRSALYGSDAIGGVIQIFTRRSDADAGWQPRLSVGVGSHGRIERGVGLSGGNADTRLDLGLSLDETDGFARTTLEGSNDSAYRNKAANINFSHRFNQRLQAGISALRQSGDTEYDYSLSPAGFAQDDFELSSLSTFVEGQINPLWKSRLELGHTEDRRTTEDPFGGSTFNTYRDQANWINTLELNNAQTLILGADWYQDRLNSSNEFNRNSRINRAAFALHRFSGDQFSTEIGMRHDRNQQFGSENTWNAAGTWHLNPQNDLILSYSQAFRAPTFNDLYYPDSCFMGACTVYANPDLKPETAQSYELQWRSQLTASTRLETALYRTLIRDAIVTNNALDGNQAGSNDPFRPENIDKARINGFEATLKQDMFGWLASASYSLIDARNASGGGNDGNRLARRPKNSLTLDLDRSFNAFSVGAGWTLNSHSYDDLNNENRIPGYGVLGVRGSWQANDELRFNVAVDNLLDRDYYQARGSAFDADTFAPVSFRYREGGRTAMLSAVWTPRL